MRTNNLHRNCYVKRILVVWLGFFASNGMAKSDADLTVMYTEACPYMCPNGPQKGFDVDILEAIFSKSKYQLKFVNVPWARAVSTVQRGQADMLLGAAKAEAPGLIFSNMELAPQRECFNGRGGDAWQPTRNGQSFLHRKTIVFSGGWTFKEKFVAELGDVQYQNVFLEFSLNDDYLNRSVKMVVNNRADAFWQEPVVVNHFIENNPQYKGKIVNLGCIKNSFQYMGFNPKNPALSRKLVQIYDEGFRQLRKSGELKNIMRNYGASDWD